MDTVTDTSVKLALKECSVRAEMEVGKTTYTMWVNLVTIPDHPTVLYFGEGEKPDDTLTPDEFATILTGLEITLEKSLRNTRGDW